MRKYRDASGNTYRVEKASNGNWVAVRVNQGGNRKLARNVGEPCNGAVPMQRSLDAFAAKEGWKEIPQ